jgi:hypothetical protein
MARNRDIFNMVQNVPGRNELPRNRKPIPTEQTGRGGGYSPGIPTTGPGAGMMAPPGVSGMGDIGLGQMYSGNWGNPGSGINPEWFGSGEGQWSQMQDVGESMWMWQQYLDALEGGIDLQDLFGDEFSPEYWEQQEAGYDWWNNYGPGMGQFYNEFDPEWGIGPGAGTGIQYGNFAFSPYQTVSSATSGAQAGPGVGGGQQGGTGDLGTGSAFAGGSMYTTLMGGGVEYDCATQGPSYNTQGECIACCEASPFGI